MITPCNTSPQTFEEKFLQSKLNNSLNKFNDVLDKHQLELFGTLAGAALIAAIYKYSNEILAVIEEIKKF